MTKYSLPPGVIVERVGDDLMVVLPGNSDVVSLSGRPAEILLDVKTGRRVDCSDPVLRELVDLGVISAPGLSRRGLIRAGAVGAGAGIAVLAMPGVAAASSDPNVNDGGNGNGNGGNDNGDPTPLPGEILVDGDWVTVGSEPNLGYQFTVVFADGDPDFVTGDFNGPLTVYVDGTEYTVPFDYASVVTIGSETFGFVGFEIEPANFTLTPETTYFGRFEEGAKQYFATFVDQD